MLAHEVLSSLRGLMLPQALEMRGDGSGTQQQQQQQQREGGGFSPEGDQEPAGSGRGGMGLGSLMEACLPRSGAAKEGEFVIDVGSLNLGEEGEDSSEDDDSFLWQSSHGSEMASAGKSRSRRSRREKKWNCYGEDSVSITSSEDCSFISSEASSTGGPSHPSSPFHSYGSHRRTNGVPDPRDVIDYAQFLGIDPVKEPNLLHIAEEGLLAPLPEGWTEHKDAEGNIYYYNAGDIPTSQRRLHASHVALLRPVKGWVRANRPFYRDRDKTAPAVLSGCSLVCFSCGGVLGFMRPGTCRILHEYA